MNATRAHDIEVVYLDRAGQKLKELMTACTPEGVGLSFYADAEAEDERREILESAHCLLTATFEVDAALMDKAAGIRLIQKTGVGTDNIHLDSAASRGIPVANTAGANATAVAEMTILFALALYRRLIEIDAETRRGEWPMWEHRHHSFELAGKTHGIVGFGAIGREVSRRSVAFGTEVVYFDTVGLPEAERELGAKRAPSIDELLSVSDLLSLHVPLVERTRDLIGDAQFRLMKPEAILINVARGGVVNESALYRALADGRIQGAALDVWEEEPLTPDNPLLGLPNVIATPHIGAGTRDTLQKVLEAAFTNISKLGDGEDLRGVVNGVI